MNHRQATRRQYQTAIRRLREGRNTMLDLGVVAQVDQPHVHANRGGHGWIIANWPIPAVMAGSRRTAARVTPGAISLRSSSHFPHKLYSNCIKPVALPPGLDRLSTKPATTGSATRVNTIGTERVAWSNGPKTEPPEAKMTSGSNATSSAAY